MSNKRKTVKDKQKERSWKDMKTQEVNTYCMVCGEHLFLARGLYEMWEVNEAASARNP